jgi:hypothetical protein
MTRPNLAHILFLPKLVCRVNEMTSKFPGRCFIESSKMILEFIWRDKGTRIHKTSLRKEQKLEVMQRYSASLVLPETQMIILMRFITYISYFLHLIN